MRTSVAKEEAICQGGNVGWVRSNDERWMCGDDYPCKRLDEASYVLLALQAGGVCVSLERQRRVLRRWLVRCHGLCHLRLLEISCVGTSTLPSFWRVSGNFEQRLASQRSWSTFTVSRKPGSTLLLRPVFGRSCCSLFQRRHDFVRWLSGTWVWAWVWVGGSAMS